MTQFSGIMFSFAFPEDVNQFRCGEEVLLLNSLTCTWARIHETEYKKIEALIENGVGKGTELPVKARQLLIDHILSTKDHKLELPQKELLEYLDHPRVVYYEVTKKCNLHCVYCYADGGCKVRGELDKREALHLMEEVAGLGVETVVFTGGEPLLREDLWDIVQEAHGHNMKTALITNGTLITEDNAETIARQVDRVTVSLDSIDPCIHDSLRDCGTWERVIKSLLLLTQYCVPVDISITLTGGNQHTIVETLSYIAEHRLGTPKFSPYLMCGRGETQDLAPSLEKLVEDLPRILHLLHESGLAPPLPEKRVRRIHCGMGHSEFGISADGRVYPCRLLQLPELCAGRVGNDSLHTVYYESRHFQMVRRLTVDTIPYCCTCTFRHFCGGGCRAAGFYTTRDLRGVDPLNCLYNKMATLMDLWVATGVDFEEGDLKCIQNGIML